MVRCTLEITDTISNFAGASNLVIGIYECHNSMDYVRITNRVPEILHLNESETEYLFSNPDRFKEWMQQTERAAGIFGVISEYTEEIMEKRSLQVKAGQDTLTGLYNRRSLDYKLDEWMYADKRQRKELTVQ